MFTRIAQKLRRNNPQYLDRIRIEQGEILSQMDCEAILFFMHPNLEWGGGLNSNVLEIAGPELDSYILNHIHKPKSGQVFALPPFQSGYKAMFMAVLNDWDGGNGFEERDLLNCYRHTIEKAEKMGIRSIAIPAMGRDKRDFPHIRFARVAVQGIMERISDKIDFVKIMCLDWTMRSAYQNQIDKLRG